jgi:hypothetical protein
MSANLALNPDRKSQSRDKRTVPSRLNTVGAASRPDGYEHDASWNHPLAANTCCRPLAYEENSRLFCRLACFLDLHESIETGAWCEFVSLTLQTA